MTKDLLLTAGYLFTCFIEKCKNVCGLYGTGKSKLTCAFVHCIFKDEISNFVMTHNLKVSNVHQVLWLQPLLSEHCLSLVSCDTVQGHTKICDMFNSSDR